MTTETRTWRGRPFSLRSWYISLMSISLFSNLSIDQTWLLLLWYLTKTAGSLTKPLRCKSLEQYCYNSISGQNLRNRYHFNCWWNTDREADDWTSNGRDSDDGCSNRKRGTWSVFLCNPTIGSWSVHNIYKIKSKQLPVDWGSGWMLESAA